MNTENTLSTRYDAAEIESLWYSKWENAGLFQESTATQKPLYTITIPPPNITGSLHMGHALCYPIQDLVGRYKRLRGHNVLIIPGQDHAGIATQSVVSKLLKSQGIQPSELGREKFVEEVWKFREQSGSTILGQLRQLGCAFDWQKQRFTLDPDYANAVLKVFIEWFNRGIIYRGKRVVNWDPVLKTSVSDIETLREEINGKLYHVRYPFDDNSGYILVATTRPETMLGDVAVAVNPSDARYSGLIGKELRLPLTGRIIPLIADLYPDPEFGTGAVKITPAHDPNDYEVGVRHNLEMPVILDEDAKVCLEGPYFGMDRFEARKAIVTDLERDGLLEKIEDHVIAIIKSDRSREIVEPLLSEQWFAKMTDLAAPAIEAVRTGSITFVPERYTKVYLDWMENIRDWNISRQLWWGHRVPVYYTKDGQAYAAMSWEQAQEQAGDNPIVRQDDDVLDTWFSSGLWPFATQGWPQSDELLERRYPTDVLVTDRNIIYLWVARMAMMGLDFIKEKPFSQVYIHATVMTEDGKRMSKSLGTGVDPMTIISTMGADILRFTLLSQAGMNQEIRYSERRTEDARNFCNKIWNASRFILMNLGNAIPERPAESEFVPADRWILSRLARTEITVRKAYDGFDMQAAANTLYTFFWSEVCDWYIEISKSRLSDEETANSCRWVLVQCFDAFLKMIHPIMPFISEEIYSKLPIANKGDFLMNATWPEHLREFADHEAEKKAETWLEWVRVLRALRSELDITPRKLVEKAYYIGDLRGGESVIRSQAWFGDLINAKPEGQCVSRTVEGVDFYLPSADAVDVTKLEAELAKISAELVKLDARLNNPDFMSRAKPEVIARDQATAEDLRDRATKLQARIQEAGL